MAPKRPLGNPSPVSSFEDEDSSSEAALPPSPELTAPISTPETSRKKKMKGPSPSPSDEDEKKVAFQRICGDEDVIAILECMIALKDDTGAHVYDHIKDAISFGVSEIQMSYKIRSLKRKYLNNAMRGEGGKDPVFPKPQDRKTFQLSKLIWGGTSNAGNKTTMKLRSMAHADEFTTRYPTLHKFLDFHPPEFRSEFEDDMRLLRPSKVKKMDEEWRKFYMKDYNLIMKRSQFLDVSRALGLGEDK